MSELFFDWGWLGIILGSIFLGLILGKLRLDRNNAPWKNAFILLMMRWIVYIPRASFFEWLTRAFNIWNIAIVVLIYVAIGVIEKKQRISL